MLAALRVLRLPSEHPDDIPDTSDDALNAIASVLDVFDEFKDVFVA